MMTYDDSVNQLIETAICEDIGDGDHSSLSSIPESAMGTAQLLVKQDGILAGIEVAKRVFQAIDSNMELELFLADGAKIKKGDIAFKVSGKVQKILQAERLVLNFMQRMSGIATVTNQYVQKLVGLPTKVLDTRKTTPGLRFIEKEAVRIGGGVNHRIGLYDMVMLKDNHIDFAGGMEQAIRATQNYLKENGKDLKIEVEVRTFDDILEVMRIGGIHRIMFDNFSVANTKKAVEMVAGKFETESSGGITFDTIRDYAEAGVDFVSVGALTHHIRSLDLSLKAI